MRKKITYSLLGFGAIIIAGSFAFSLFVDSIVKSGIEEVGSKMMGSQVTVEEVSLSTFSESGTIEGLKVDNPDGFESEHAMVLQDFKITLDISSVFSDEIIVEEITFSEPVVSVIQKVPENNLAMLMSNLDESMSEGSSSSSTMVIEHLLVQNGQVTVTPSIGGSKSATVKMDRLELNNVGEKGKSSTEQVVNQVATKIMNEALQKAVSGELQNLKGEAKDALEDMFN